jgi:hypothetical protein
MHKSPKNNRVPNAKGVSVERKPKEPLVLKERPSNFPGIVAATWSVLLGGTVSTLAIMSLVERLTGNTHLADIVGWIVTILSIVGYIIYIQMEWETPTVRTIKNFVSAVIAGFFAGMFFWILVPALFICIGLAKTFRKFAYDIDNIGLHIDTKPPDVIYDNQSQDQNHVPLVTQP